MKTKEIILAVLFFGFLLTANAQNKQDTIENGDVIISEILTTSPKLRSMASMGYHRNNYKHPAKAERAKAFYKEGGYVHKTFFPFKYKMPYTNFERTDIEKISVTPHKPVKRSRNYKQPYSAN